MLAAAHNVYPRGTVPYQALYTRHPYLTSVKCLPVMELIPRHHVDFPITVFTADASDLSSPPYRSRVTLSVISLIPTGRSVSRLITLVLRSEDATVQSPILPNVGTRKQENRRDGDGIINLQLHWTRIRPLNLLRGTVGAYVQRSEETNT